MKLGDLIMKIEEVKDILTNPDYAYYLHGTGRGGDEYQAGVVSSIFDNGLRASHNAMYWTTVCYGTGKDVENSWAEMIDDMNHWKHLDSKNIIIVRFPIKYLILGADDSLGEKDYAIYNEIENPETKQVTRYINPKMVVGCYHATTGEFFVNPNFEKELSPETEKILQEKYEEGVKNFQDRINFVDVPMGIKQEGNEDLEEKADNNNALAEISEEELQSLWDKWE